MPCGPHCTRCDFHLTSKVLNNLHGSGGTASGVMLVGQAPGAAEEAHNDVLQGETGFLLQDLLLHTGLIREQVYITNAIRCRPPQSNGADPTKKKHIDACR